MCVRACVCVCVCVCDIYLYINFRESTNQKNFAKDGER